MLTITYCLFLSRAHDQNRELKRKTQKSAKESMRKIYMNLDIATILRKDAFKLDYKISAHKKGTLPCSG